MKKGILGAVMLVAVAVGLFIILGNKTNAPAAKTETTSHSQTQNTTTTQVPAAATITYTSSGYSPAITTVKSGDTVAIKNDSSSSIQFDSDPHPDHTDNVELNVGVVNAGETKTFKVTTKGTFGFHNHFNTTDRGTLVVE